MKNDLWRWHRILGMWNLSNPPLAPSLGETYPSMTVIVHLQLGVYFIFITFNAQCLHITSHALNHLSYIKYTFLIRRQKIGYYISIVVWLDRRPDNTYLKGNNVPQGMKRQNNIFYCYYEVLLYHTQCLLHSWLGKKSSHHV